MARSRNSAKQAGARFERNTADWLRDNVSEWIDRKVKTGAADKGDIANVRTHNNERVVVECKDYGGRLEAGTWIKEAETERVNDEAIAGIVVAKRKGTTDPGDQYVITTLRDFTAILTGVRPPK